MINKVKDGIYLHQSDLIEKIEKHFGKEIEKVQEFKTPATPEQGTVKVNKEDICLTKKEQFK